MGMSLSCLVVNTLLATPVGGIADMEFTAREKLLQVCISM